MQVGRMDGVNKAAREKEIMRRDGQREESNPKNGVQYASLTVSNSQTGRHFLGLLSHPVLSVSSHDFFLPCCHFNTSLLLCNCCSLLWVCNKHDSTNLLAQTYYLLDSGAYLT